MCFTVSKMRPLKTRRVYKVFYQSLNGDLIGLYYNMKFRLGKIKRISARGAKIHSIDKLGRSAHGLYVYTSKTRGKRAQSASQSYTSLSKVVLVLCEVDPRDFLHRSTRGSRAFLAPYEATYRAIKPLKVIS